MCDFSQMPKGFFVYGSERNDAGDRVHEMLENRRFSPTPEEFEALIAKVKSWREIHEMDGKEAEANGDEHLAGSCRRVVGEIDVVLATWRARWRKMRDEQVTA